MGGKVNMTQQCGRGHSLRVPYVFMHIQFVGPDVGELLNAFAPYADWDAVNSAGRPKPEGIYLCGECALELFELMERWREGDTDVEELIKKWNRDNGHNADTT